jgi:predicted amidohydrolase
MTFSLLVPTDFLQPAACALAYADMLAAAIKAQCYTCAVTRCSTPSG